MSEVRPRAIVHRGRLAACGVLLERSLLGEAEARRRALAAWEPGLRVLEIEGGLVLRFARPRLLDATLAAGHLLVERAGLLLAAPLTPAELAALGAPPGSVVAVRAGRAVALATGAEPDLAAWLGLDPAMVPVHPLGSPPPAPAPAPAPPEVDLRRALAIAPAAPQAARTVKALRDAARRQPESGPGAVRQTLGSALRRAFGWLREEASLLAMIGRPSGAAAARATTVRALAPPGFLTRALRRFAERLAILTRLSRLAGLRQGLYFDRLLRMFERGDIEEALRHAIPLRGEGGLDELLALGVPRARASLAISAGPAAGGGTIGVGGALYSEMQRLYRRAFEQLAARERIDEAAFVLAELLRADLEAVSFLERHGKLVLAAEMAEARALPAGLVVRQWFLARDVERAVRSARARRAFADAVERLERSGKREEGAALRVLWAEDLAEAGDLEAAVRVVWPVESARRVAAAWIERAVLAGGPTGHALLPRWLELAPDRFHEARDRVLVACANETGDGPDLRAALARGLSCAPRSPNLQILARLALRGVLRDRAAGQARLVDVVRLTALAADGALDADLPVPSSARVPRGVIMLELRSDDAGTRPVLDAAALPGGRILVALGEAGAILLTRDGRSVARFDVPAHRLVVSDLGTRALALAPRGEAIRVSRLDLETGTARPLRDLSIRTFARSYDGATWAVATDDAVLVLDTLRDDLRTLWNVSALPGAALALERNAAGLSFVTFKGPGVSEGWFYEGLTLRCRAPLAPARQGEKLLALGAFSQGRWFSVVCPDGEANPVLRSALESVQGAHPLPGAESVLDLVGGDAAIAATRTANGVEVVALEPASLRVRALVTLAGARSATVRAVGERVTLADDRGRIVALDLDAGRVIHDLRM